MYAVIYKNRVIVGPMDWNRAIFQGSLEKEGVAAGIPRVAPGVLPYVINEDARIALVEEQRPEINSLVEIHSLMTELKKVKNDKKYGQAFRE